MAVEYVQHRAIHAFWGVGKYTPNLVPDSLMGWTSSYNRRQTHMARFWKRIQYMENDRLPKMLMDRDRKLALEGRKTGMCTSRR